MRSEDDGVTGRRVGRPGARGRRSSGSAGLDPGLLWSFLEGLYAEHHRLGKLHPDPLVFARRFEEAEHGEVAGLAAAALAYGQVNQIMATLETVSAVLGPQPRKFLERSAAADLQEATRGFAYRFHKERDLALLLHLVTQALGRFGSLREAFLADDPGGPIGAALTAFAEKLLSGDARPILTTRDVPAGHPVRHFLPSPARGGAAKRLCLYLRWMVRKDELDPGFWHGAVDPARLVVPLDTHVARVGRELGLTARRTADWKTASEITDSLRRYDPRDPVRYDFSLFRYGMGKGR